MGGGGSVRSAEKWGCDLCETENLEKGGKDSMSVTVADLLELPSLREARLAAGRGGLNKLVSSISVLEYADPSILQDALFKNNEFYGSEVVITGFMNIPNDVEAQCANIRRLAEAGEVGLILYYVGVFLPRVDRKLLELADELDFALIVMPENRMDQRYSEVICEVMEAIFKDQNTSAALVSDILDRASLLPEHQRTVDTVLKLLSDRTRASAVLTDGAGRVLNAVAWPRTAAVDLEERLRRLESLPEAGGAPLELRAGEARCLLYRCALSDPAPGMELFLFKEGEPLTADLVRQAGEVVRLAANLWSQSHDRVVMSELVRAILKDEPIKMRRLAEIFHVDVGSIHSMWVLRPGLEGREEFRAKGLELVRELLAHHCTTVVADWYEGDLVAFMDWPAGGGEAGALADMCCAQLEQAGLRAVLTLCQSLATTADVRRAYLAIRAFQNDAAKIWPGKRWYTVQEVEFAQSCRAMIEEGEEAVQQRLAVLAPIREEGEAELERTLQILLLDAGSSVARTAELLFLHKNTVKYRLQRTAGRLGYPVGKMPETFALYTACALERLLAP